MTSSTPVTVLCGGLGAGKTTLLSHLLESDDRDIAVLVNDVGDVNVDADLVEARTDLGDGEGELVALENGCICCSLGGELSRAVIRLWQQYDFDALVVEASGVGEPEPIASQFTRGPAGGPYDLDAIVTVVDARTFFDTFVDGEEGGHDDPTPPERHGPDDTGSRPLADLWLEQIEFCDLLVVNKCDLVSEAERDTVVALLETLQPRAEVVTCEYGDLESEVILESDRFDLDAARKAAGWKQAVEADPGSSDHGALEAESDGSHGHDHSHSDHDHDERGHDDHSRHDEHSHDHGEHDGHNGHDEHSHHDSHDRYGIEVDGYHRTRPFHPQRFTTLLTALPDGLIRAKGLCWVAGRERQALTMSFAGTQTTLEVTGRWIASFPEDRQEAYRRGQPDLPWDEQWGDRESRLALIGRNLEVDALKARLDECLLTDTEMDQEWTDFENSTPTAMGTSVVISEGDE